jgi:16S rRNA (cytidine1402-2'-O)-methyltransferase
VSLKDGLYVVSTPIGNMGDITLRALEVLKLANKIACEDTRVTKKILSRYGINNSLTSYHDYNADNVRPALIEEIRKGLAVALVSDAGTPAISDPGYKLIRECIEAELFVTMVPGPSAALSALVLSGLPTDRFLFLGYLPPKSAQRKRVLNEISTISATIIFYESAGRLVKSLKDMVQILGDRRAAVLREMTKLHEEVYRSSLEELTDYYSERTKILGEIVIVVGPAQPVEILTDREIKKILEQRLKSLSLKDAVFEVASITKQPRKKIYKIAIKLESQLGQRFR